MSDDPVARLRAADPLHGELPPPLERMPALDRAPSRARRWRDTVLVAANLVLLATVLLHGVDHALIQERGIRALSFEVALGGMSITAVSALSLAVALLGDRRAPMVALLTGPWVAAAVVIGHFIPNWGEFSDPYEEAGLEAVSYVLALATAMAGVALAAVAVVARRMTSPGRSRMSY
jgi:hypothetical protein